MICEILKAIMVFSGLGFVCGAALAVAAKLFHVYEDPRIEAVRDCLPGVDCAACGFPGCMAAAKAVVAGTAQPDVCKYGGQEISECVAVALGLEGIYREPKVAVLTCDGGKRADNLFTYNGLMDCRAAALLNGGFKKCAIGCLGLGTCEQVCPFGAIHVGDNQLPIIDQTRCRGCGKCQTACPKGIIALTGLTDRLLRMSQSRDCLSPCTQKCPAQINVPKFIRQLRSRDYVSALLTIKERNPFPIACGRVCTHPCENICRRNIADEAVAINRLERFLGDWEMNSGKHLPLDCAPETGHRVAIVGGGPAGLTCAYFLRRLGHSPVIFEAMPELGGMLRYGIPEYRLPKNKVQWEIQGILDLGVEVYTDAQMGVDFDLKTLENAGFEAVVLAVGAWVTPLPEIPGTTKEGVLGGIYFLDHVGTSIVNLEHKRVVVVGESNTAMDCARTSMRLCAESVTVICPCVQKKMSARKRDVIRAVEEGVKIEFLASPVRITSDADNAVTHIDYMHLPEDDNNAKGTLKNYDTTISTIPADLVISALERKPDLDCLKDRTGRCPFKIKADGTLAAEPDTLRTNLPHVFTAGDMYTGRASVISALGGGRRAARSVHLFLTQGNITVPDNLMHGIIPQSILKNIKVCEPIERIHILELPPDIRRKSFVEEVVSTMTETQVQNEARRCLVCGLTCYNH